MAACTQDRDTDGTLTGRGCSRAGLGNHLCGRPGRKTGTAPRTDFTTPTARTDRSISIRPQAALPTLPHTPQRPSGRCAVTSRGPRCPRSSRCPPIDRVTVAEFTAKVHAMTGHTGYTIRQAAYDLRKLRGKHLIAKPGRTRPLPPLAADRGHLRRPADPSRAGHRTDPRRGPQPPRGRKPVTWTSIDRDYEKIRIDMQTLFQDLGIRAAG